jgi:hypothetical protein
MVLRGRVVLLPLPGFEKRKVELAVLWETEGKGGTDLGVVYYRVLADGDYEAATGTHPFEVTLPALPLSYRGSLIKIGWRVRVRRLDALANDAVYDEPFELAWQT